MATGFTNAQLPTSILTDALAEKVGNARSPEVMRHVLVRLEAQGWTFRRHDEAQRTDELRAQLRGVRSLLNLLSDEVGIDLDETRLTFSIVRPGAPAEQIDTITLTEWLGKLGPLIDGAA